MDLEIYSYRFGKEILQHPDHSQSWNEIESIVSNTPIFQYPGKSSKNDSLDVVQQIMNTYYDYRFTIENDWEYHPLATEISESGLAADFRKSFGDLTVQVEVQFGNMARWYSDIFKFQTAYSQGLADIGLCIVPVSELAKRIDSNVVNYERVIRELPHARLSITLPIVIIGLRPTSLSKIVDISKSKFGKISEITGGADNRWRIINSFINNKPITDVGPESEIGQKIEKK